MSFPEKVVFAYAAYVEDPTLEKCDAWMRAIVENSCEHSAVMFAEAAIEREMVLADRVHAEFERTRKVKALLDWTERVQRIRARGLDYPRMNTWLKWQGENGAPDPPEGWSVERPGVRLRNIRIDGELREQLAPQPNTERVEHFAWQKELYHND